MLAKCDYCAGPANWTMIGGSPHFWCKSQCDGFMQMEMALDGARMARYVDKPVSVSALPETETDEASDALPF